MLEATRAVLCDYLIQWMANRGLTPSFFFFFCPQLTSGSTTRRTKA